MYDFIHPNASATATVRSLLIIDPEKKVRLIITYPASTGRNFNEILRVLDSLQLTDNYKVATPVSYTHLDVYKRQVLEFSARKVGPKV